MSGKWPYPRQQQWEAWSPQLPRKKRGKDQPKKPKSEEVTFKSYDAMEQSEGGASSSQQQSAAQDFMQEFISMAKEQNLSLPPNLQKFLPSSEMETRQTLKDQQKRLNKHRNVLTKINNKERALEKDEEKWNSWLKELRDMISKEKNKHDETQQRLKKELEDLRKEEEQIRNQKDEEEVPEEDEHQEKDPLQSLDLMADATPNDAQKKINEDAVLEQKMKEMQQRLEREYAQKLRQQKKIMEQQCMNLLAQGRVQEVVNVEDDEEMADGTSKRPGSGNYGAQKARARTDLSPYSRQESARANEHQKDGENLMEMRMLQPQEIQEAVATTT